MLYSILIVVHVIATTTGYAGLIANKLWLIVL